MLGTTLPTPLYPLYQRELDISSPIVTVIFAIYAVAVIAGLLFFGHQSDRVGRKRTLLTGLVLSGMSALCFIFANSLIPIYAGRVLSGISAGIFTGAGTAAMVDYATGEKRRTITLLAVVVNVGGLGLGTLLSGLLAQYAPLPLQLPYIADLVLVIVAIWAILAAPETVANARGRMNFSMQHLRVPEEIRATFTRAAIVGACAFAVSGVFSAVAPGFLGVVLGVHSPAISGVLVFVLMGASALGQFVVPRIPPGAAFQAGCITLVLGMAFLAATIATHSLALIFLSAFASGVGQGVVMGFGLANINERITERRGEVTSAYFVVVYAGLALPVVAVGFAAIPLGLPLAGEIFAGIIGAVCLAAALAGGRMEREHAGAG